MRRRWSAPNSPQAAANSRLSWARSSATAPAPFRRDLDEGEFEVAAVAHGPSASNIGASAARLGYDAPCARRACLPLLVHVSRRGRPARRSSRRRAPRQRTRRPPPRPVRPGRPPGACTASWRCPRAAAPARLPGAARPLGGPADERRGVEPRALARRSSRACAASCATAATTSSTSTSRTRPSSAGSPPSSRRVPLVGTFHCYSRSCRHEHASPPTSRRAPPLQQARRAHRRLRGRAAGPPSASTAAATGSSRTASTSPPRGPTTTTPTPTASTSCSSAAPRRARACRCCCAPSRRCAAPASTPA